MNTRNSSMFALAVGFSVFAVGAAIWGYMRMSTPQPQATVEIQQVPVRGWGVEVKELSSVIPQPKQARKEILTAEAADSAASQ